MSHRVVVFIGPTLRQAQGAAQAAKQELMGTPIRIMSGALAQTALEMYGPGAELRLVNSHRLPAAAWDGIQTCASKGATITRIGEQ